jgi:segregation and condensation protein A
VQFEQVMALGELVVRWTGSTTGDVEVSDEFDDPQPMSEQE